MTSPHKTFPKLGAFFWSFDETPPSHKELLQRFTKLGLNVAQIGDPYVSDLIKDRTKRKDFVRDFEDAGVEIVGIAAYRNICSLDTRKRRESLDYLKAALDLAPELGTFAVATETGTLNTESDWSPSPKNSTPQAWNIFLESTTELITAAENSGSILAYEGYVNNIVGRLDQLEKMFDLFPSRNLGLMLDPYNYITRNLLPTADLICEEFLDRFCDRFVMAHLKDVAPLGADGVAGDEDPDRADLVGTPEFCTGVFPQQPYLRFLRDRRPDLPIIFEHLPDAHLPAAIERFRALTGTLPQP